MRRKELPNSSTKAALGQAKPAAGLSTLHHAAKNGSLDIIQLLIQKGSGDLVKLKTTSCGSTALHFAVEFNHLPVVEYLLRHHDIEINARNFKSQTPLDIACLHKRRSAKTLIERAGGLNVAFDPLSERRAASGLRI
jgi:ankyrin repeat protein